LETLVLCAADEHRLLAWDTTLLRNCDGAVDGVAAIGADITGQRAVESQVRQAKKLEGIAHMAAALAHDFNNILTVILGQSAYLLEGMSEPDPMYQSLSAIYASAMQCAGLTEQLLAVGGKQRMKPAVFNLNSVIQRAEAVLKSLVGDRIVLELQLHRSLRPIHADEAQLQRVLANLALNARDAMPDGGRLTLTTENADLVEASARPPARKPGSYVRLTVTDTGVGMSEEVQARIFDPFFTTKPSQKGTGLGLSTVYGIVGQSGGYIAVSSRPGAGASFEILLPAAQLP
jgi:signal transduction histidine kinase